MVTLPIMWKIIDPDWRYTIQLFIDDSLHSEVINIIKEWLYDTCCILCSCYKCITFKEDSMFTVTPMHIHFRWGVEDLLNSYIHCTLEKLDDLYNFIPNFMLDGVCEYEYFCDLDGYVKGLEIYYDS